jgi:hypothetical protein
LILAPVLYCLRGGEGFLPAVLTEQEIDNAKPFFAITVTVGDTALLVVC